MPETYSNTFHEQNKHTSKNFKTHIQNILNTYPENVKTHRQNIYKNTYPENIKHTHLGHIEHISR